MMSFCGMFVEIKDLILWKSKTCQWCLYPSYYPIIFLSLKINSLWIKLLFLILKKYAAAMLSLKTCIWMTWDFRQSSDNYKIWKFCETAMIDLMPTFALVKIPIPMQKHQEYWIIKKIGYLSMSLPDSQTIRAIGSQITFYDMINSIFSEKV